jgi:hypothetical protein
MKFLYLFFVLTFSFTASAYVNFIGHGYTSCLNCHYNPAGGGPLNDYGRVVGATLISSGALYPKDWSEEKIAYTSGFLFRKPKQNWLRTQINYRGFQLVQNPGSEANQTERWINMQFDGRVILKFGENDKFVSVLNYGYAPLPPGEKIQGVKNQTEWRSREHYAGYRFTPKFGMYAGLMDKVFGLRTIEHIAYSRSIPQMAQNDQVHGVKGHFLGEKWELFGQLFVGNLSQAENLRMKGATGMIERTVFDTHRVGASLSQSENNFLTLLSYSAHAKFNLKEGSALLAEIGQTSKESKTGNNEDVSRFGLLQTYLRPLRGFYVFNNIEYKKDDVNRDDYTVRWGPGVQYFPIQRFEFRFDMYNERNFSPDSSTKDRWTYLFQTHIWL